MGQNEKNWFQVLNHIAPTRASKTPRTKNKQFRSKTVQANNNNNNWSILTLETIDKTNAKLFSHLSWNSFLFPISVLMMTTRLQLRFRQDFSFVFIQGWVFWFLSCNGQTDGRKPIIRNSWIDGKENEALHMMAFKKIDVSIKSWNKSLKWIPIDRWIERLGAIFKSSTDLKTKVTPRHITFSISDVGALDIEKKSDMILFSLFAILSKKSEVPFHFDSFSIIYVISRCLLSILNRKMKFLEQWIICSLLLISFSKTIFIFVFFVRSSPNFHIFNHKSIIITSFSSATRR